MISEVVNLAVVIVRFVDDCQPGIVAGEFVDAYGHQHIIIEKAPILSVEILDANNNYPRPGYAHCVVLDCWRDASERDLVRISTADPDSIETSGGLSEFVVLKTQISLVG
jgi:hypothetical protein